MWKDGSIIPAEDFMKWIKPGLDAFAKNGPNKPRKIQTVKQLRKQVLSRKKMREKQENND
jgi:hypothetical protein